MKVIIVTGTPAASKIDCLETSDDKRYQKLDIPVTVGLSDYICPDHFYVANLEEVFDWAKDYDTEVLVLETAGLCHHCAPAAICSYCNGETKIGSSYQMGNVKKMDFGEEE